MLSPSRFLQTHSGGRLGRRLLFWIVLGSIVFTLIGTAVQLSFDYRKDMDVLHAQLNQIQTSRVSSLSNSLWYLDEDQVLVQLDGILDLPDIKYAQVNTPDGMTFLRGVFSAEKTLVVRAFPLLYRGQERSDRIGTLVVAADTSAIRQRLQNRFFLILLTQGVQISLLSIVIVSIFYMFVTRHLRQMASYTSELTIDRLRHPLVLNKAVSPGKPDEIDTVVSAFNSMRENLLKDIIKREETEAKLKFAEGYIRNILDSMPSILISVDLDGRITHWNARAQAVTGISPEVAVGELFEQVFPNSPVTVARIMTAIASNIPEKISKHPNVKEEVVTYSDVTIYPLATNSVQGAVIRIDDVTERVRMEEMVVQSEKMLSVGGLAAGMAHEINNPLAGILQNVQVLKNRLSGDLPANVRQADELGLPIERLREYFERRGCMRMIDSIMDSGKRAARIVENMLSFSRKSNVLKGSVDIRNLLDRTLELASNDYDLKKQYDFRKIEIVREYGEVPFVPCEESKIQQVFYNIIRNGAQAMAECKTVHPRFTLRVYAVENDVRIEIEDNGPGMSEEVRKRIFEPFFTTKRVGEGTGLGLSVSYFIIVENHGGALEVFSTPGKGTVFFISLPLTSAEAGECEPTCLTSEVEHS